MNGSPGDWSTIREWYLGVVWVEKGVRDGGKRNETYALMHIYVPMIHILSPSIHSAGPFSWIQQWNKLFRILEGSEERNQYTSMLHSQYTICTHLGSWLLHLSFTTSWRIIVTDVTLLHILSCLHSLALGITHWSTLLLSLSWTLARCLRISGDVICSTDNCPFRCWRVRNGGKGVGLQREKRFS